MIEHDRFLFLAAKDLSAPLAPDETAELDAHLVTCPLCTAESGGFQRDHRALVRSLHEVPVGAHVLPKVLGRAAGRRRTSVVPALAAAALLILALAAIALIAGSPRPGPAADPFRGSWRESPDDGPVTTVTISGSGPSRLVEFIDEVAARCGGDVAIGAGSGSVTAPTVIEGEFSRVECRDGSSVAPFPFRFTYDEETGLLRDQDGVAYARDDASPPSPSPAVSAIPSAPPSSPSTPPSIDIDQVSGNYTYTVFGDSPERSVTVEASGSDSVTGTWTFHALPDGAPQSGPVTCLLVRGNEAFLFGPPADEGGRGAFLWVIDGGAADDRAITWMQDLPGDPLPANLEPQTLDEMEGWCRNAGEGYPDRENTPPVPLLSGGLSVHDAP